MSELFIQYEDTFKSVLKNDFNLFLGAGFSMLATNSSGENLPLGNSLRDELAVKYNKPSVLSLPQICQIIEKTPKYKELNEFLTNKFKVAELKGNCQKYKVLLPLKVKNIFTTNIDNLPYLIFDDNDTYINDIRLYGPNTSISNAIDYYPLHGSVMTPDKGYNFNPISIGTFGSRGYFKDLSAEIRKRPFLFLGYSCADNNIITALFDSASWLQEHQDKWILVYDKSENEYFEALGFKIINGSIDGFLEYIQTIVDELSDNIKVSSLNKETQEALKDYFVPLLKDTPSLPLTDFFNGQDPQWSHIFSNELYRTSYFSEMENNINKGRNTLIIGIPVSGKSTLLMQLVTRFNTDKIKLHLSEITKVQADFIIKKLQGKQAILFIDRICNDIDAIECLAKNKNIQIVAAEREYNFQTVSHRLKSIFGERICNISELSEQDCKGIFDSIPTSLKKSNYIKTGKQEDGFSLYELITLNIRTEEVKSRLQAALKELHNNHDELLELFIMICYVNSCRTAVSYSMIYSYLNYDKQVDWEYVYKKINQLGKMLKDVSFAFSWLGENQDYYQPRSEYFSDAAIESIQHGDKIFRNVLQKFHAAVSPLNIPNYKTFKRFAFDANLISKAYSTYEDGKEFYDLMFKRDPSEYLLQQAALFMKYKRKFKDAFFYIDRALNMAPYGIFSIKNTHAQILFAANIYVEDSDIVRSTLDKSMDILKECYEKDGRRIVHSVIFADQAIKYHERFSDQVSKEYILLAKKWVKEEFEKNSWNRDLKYKSKKLAKIYV